MEPGFEGQPPPERRGRWFYLTAGVGALLGLGLYGWVGYLVRTASVDLALESPVGSLDLAPVLGIAAAVIGFVLLLPRPTRGLASGFLIGAGVGLLVNLAIIVYEGLLAG